MVAAPRIAANFAALHQSAAAGPQETWPSHLDRSALTVGRPSVGGGKERPRGRLMSPTIGA